MSAGHVDEVLRETAGRWADRPAIRSEEGGAWTSITYADLAGRIRRVALGLVASGVGPGDMVGIYSPNRPEWTIADLAILTVGAVSVPIYATSTAGQAAFVVDDAGISVLFVGGQRQYDMVVEGRPQMGSLQRVVVLDDAIPLVGDGSEYLSDLVERGAGPAAEAELQRRIESASADDVATLIYTSGTTGRPKGAVLTHSSFLHQLRALDERFEIGPGDRSLCFLPLSHAYERGWTFYVLASGAENCYLQDPRRVVEAMGEVRPTAMVSVPRLYEKIHATVLDRMERGSAARARLFTWAVRVGGDYQRRTFGGGSAGPWLTAQHAVADRLVLSKIRDAVGGEKKVFSAGGAPLSREIEEFLFAAGLFVCQGYGLTETAAMLTCNYPGAYRFGTVGTPVLGTEVRIGDQGEIQARGGSIMSGYYGRPEDTAAAFEDGWFRTGDMGFIDDDGFLHVTDRIKDLIITSQGKNVAPQRIEGLLGADPFIEQIVVIGDRRNYLTALIEPAFPLVERFAEENGIAYGSREELVAAPEVRAMFDERIAAASVELAGYERIKRYTLMPREFSMESGEMTPTMKLRRRTIEQQFADVIDAMYDAPRPDAP